MWHGNAKKTSGGLTKADLKMNKRGRIVSRLRANNGKKMFRKNGLSEFTWDKTKKSKKSKKCKKSKKSKRSKKAKKCKKSKKH